MEVIQAVDRPAFYDFYQIAGRLLFIESLNLQLRNLVGVLFAGWQLTPVSLPDRSPDIRINFSCGERRPRIPPGLNHFEIAGGARCYTNSNELYLAIQDALIHLKETEPVAVDVLLPELPRSGDPLAATATSFAVCAALRRFGLFDLHSAGVVNPESEKGVLIVGPSGSGKSTLTLQLALAGWSYLSDDELLLGLVDGAVEARGFRSFFAVNTDQENALLKQCFEPDVTMGLKRASQAAPNLMLFISLNRAPGSEVRRLTQAEGMMRLIRACPWATYDSSIASANLEVLAALGRQAAGFELAAGRDLIEPGYAVELLSELS